MTVEEIRMWVENQRTRSELKREIGEIVSRDGARKVVAAIATIGNDCPKMIQQFINNRGECLEG